MSNFRTRPFKVRAESTKQHVQATESLKAPEKTSFETVGDSIANKSDIILNNDDGQFYGHNGEEWVPLTGGSGESACGCCTHDILPLTPEDVERRAGADYDFIIVGTGPGGSSLAYKLAKDNPDFTICILEAGQDSARMNTLAQDPATPASKVVPDYTVNPNDTNNDWGTLVRTALLSSFAIGQGGVPWHYVSNSNKAVTQVDTFPVIYPIGSDWGGTETLSSFVWNRCPNNGTWDKYEELLGENWGPTNTTNIYKELENRSSSHLLTNTLGGATPLPGEPYRNFAETGTLGDINVFDPELQGNNGPLYVNAANVNYVKNPYRIALQDVAASIFPDRFDFDKNWEDARFDELITTLQGSIYDQTDPNFSSYNPYTSANIPFGVVPPSGPEAKTWSEKQFQVLQENGYPVPLNGRNTFANSYGAPSFLYELEKAPFADRVTIVSRAYVTKLTYDQEFNEITGVEYWGPNPGEQATEGNDGWHVNQIGRSNPEGQIFSKPGCTPLDAKNNAAANRPNTKTLTARYEVIVCAGAIGTPAILQRSGIGSQQHLGMMDNPIQCINNLPGVGQNLTDPPQLVYEFNTGTRFTANLPLAPPFDGVTNISNLFYDGLFDATPDLPWIRMKASDTSTVADGHLSLLPNVGNSAVAGNSWKDTVAFAVTFTEVNKGPPFYDTVAYGTRNTSSAPGGDFPYQNFPDTLGKIQSIYKYYPVKSRGSVLIQSNDPSVPPYVSMNHFGDEDDINAFILAFKNTIRPLFEGMANTNWHHPPGAAETNDPFLLENNGPPNFISWSNPAESDFLRTIEYDDDGNVLSPPEQVFNEVAFREWIKANVRTGFYATGTCKMGDPTDVMAVCDNRGRVFNIKALRVCDASMLPIQPLGSPAAPIYMAGYNEANMITEDYADF